MKAVPVVVQHSWGTLGGGGPIGALTRLMGSRLAEQYEFVPMHQQQAAGGVDVSLLRQWVRMLREVQPDLVHVRGLGNEGFHGVLAARLAGCPRILVSVHGTQRDLSDRAGLRRSVVVKALEPATLALATHVTTVCHYAAARPFVQRHRTKLIGPLVNGVTIESGDDSARQGLRTSLGLREKDVAVASVGRLVWEKGHEDLASALTLAPASVRERTVLLIVGDGPDSEAIEARYQTTGVRTRMLGRRLDVPDILRAADVFAFPSWHENLSNALIEAMMSGVPVVATDVGGNTEIVRGGGGLLIPARNADALAAALVELIRDEPRRRLLGEEARENALANYSTEAMLQTFDNVYRTVLGVK
ncbi:glycosyltransferase [Ornithinimicrobium cerasi]|uniref:glycosyltransferase n=1 Tax=Ornithinimicrobium cerasi TaxID=2248773 RepID=UPI000EFF931F|nr:glycosyltransferase [Ornithinimicrobium cerasi]